MDHLCQSYGLAMVKAFPAYEGLMIDLWWTYAEPMVYLWQTYGGLMADLWL